MVNYGDTFDWAKGLTFNEAKFVGAYTGKGKEAAMAAGIPFPAQAAYRMLKRPHVIAAIKKLGKARAVKVEKAKAVLTQIAGKEERQEFWTEVMRGRKTVADEVKVKDRLKGSELLGKSEGDFVENINLNVKGSLSTILREAEARKLKKSADTGPKKSD